MRGSQTFDLVLKFGVTSGQLRDLSRPLLFVRSKISHQLVKQHGLRNQNLASLDSFIHLRLQRRQGLLQNCFFIFDSSQLSKRLLMLGQLSPGGLFHTNQMPICLIERLLRLRSFVFLTGNHLRVLLMPIVKNC